MNYDCFVSPKQITEYHAQSGGRFFSEENMRFFRSELESYVFNESYSTGALKPGAHDNVFITSERFVDGNGREHSPRYTVHRLLPDGEVIHLSKNQEFDDIDDAIAFVRCDLFGISDEDDTNG